MSRDSFTASLRRIGCRKSATVWTMAAAGGQPLPSSIPTISPVCMAQAHKLDQACRSSSTDLASGLRVPCGASSSLATLLGRAASHNTSLAKACREGRAPAQYASICPVFHCSPPSLSVPSLMDSLADVRFPLQPDRSGSF